MPLPTLAPVFFAAALAVSAATLVAQSAPARAPGTFTDVGPQITATTLIGTTFGKYDGRDAFYTVMRGQPAKLVAYDARTGEQLRLLPLPGAGGAWNATTAADGSVYVGTDSNGHLYRYTPGATSVEDLGQVGSQTWVWDLCPGEGDSVYLSTYPDCLVYQYSPSAGLKEVSRGPTAPGEQYARAVARDPSTGKLYVGVGSHARLVELDPKTGDKREFLPKEYHNQEFVYGTEVVGHRLFACVTNLNKSVVFDLRTGKIETVLPNMVGQQVMTKSPTDESVYYVVNGQLTRYDAATPDKPPVDVMPCQDALRFAWLDLNEPDYPGQSLLIFTRSTGIRRYNPTTGKSSTTSLTYPKEPIVIQSIKTGPDGRVWTGGYLSGGNAAYDPKTGKSEEYKGVSQSESMATLGQSLYFGVYPHGRFSVYDSTKPWNARRGNPKEVGKIEGQSRPYAATAVPELNKVFWGTIPEYGLLGGGIATYDVATEKLEFHHNVVQDQSVISLAYVDGLLAGGTTIYGGLGIPPKEKEGKFFLWDPKSNKKVYETAPVPNQPIVSAVMKGPDGHVWAVAGGTLVVFDVKEKKVLSTHELLPVKYDGNIWRDAYLVNHPNGHVYCTLRGKLLDIDPATKKATILRNNGASLLTMGPDNNFYFADDTRLWQYKP